MKKKYMIVNRASSPFIITFKEKLFNIVSRIKMKNKAIKVMNYITKVANKIYNRIIYDDDNYRKAFFK